jgi:hypothetical protein
VAQLLVTAVMDVKRALDRVEFKCGLPHLPHLDRPWMPAAVEAQGIHVIIPVSALAVRQMAGVVRVPPIVEVDASQSLELAIYDRIGSVILFK